MVAVYQWVYGIGIDDIQSRRSRTPIGNLFQGLTASAGTNEQLDEG